MRLRRGRCAAPLARRFDVFPRERLLVPRSEDGFAAPAAHLRRVTDLLGLASLAAAGCVGAFDAWNRGVAIDLDPPTRRLLEACFAPHEERLVAPLGPTFRRPRAGGPTTA